MKLLHVGYSKVNINPMLGIGLYGYFVPRYAKGFLDDLEAHGIVINLDNTRIAMISVDLCELFEVQINTYRTAIEEATGIPAQNLFISCTHTHTGPLVEESDAFEADPEPIQRYAEFVGERLVDL